MRIDSGCLTCLLHVCCFCLLECVICVQDPLLLLRKGLFRHMTACEHILDMRPTPERIRVLPMAV